MRDVVEKLYYYEHDMDHKIYNSLNLPSAIVVAAIGAIFFLLDRAVTTAGGAWWWTGVGLLAISFIAVVCASYCLLRIAHGHRYAYLNADEIRKFFESTLEYYKTRSSNPEQDALRDFENGIARQYGLATRQNARTNETRMYLRRWVFRWVVVTGLSLALSGATLAVAQLAEAFDERGAEAAASTETG